MIAPEDRRIPVTDDEIDFLVAEHFRTGLVVPVDILPGDPAVAWRKGWPYPEAARLVLVRRGVLNENLEGAGI